MHSSVALDSTGFFRGISGGDEEALCVWWRGGWGEEMRTHKNIKSGFHCLSCHSQGLFKNSRLVMGQMVRKTWPGTFQSRAAVWLFAGAG